MVYLYRQLKSFIMEIKGQISVEFILLMGFMLIVTCAVAAYIFEDSELTYAMGAARSGAVEGVIADSMAVYPEESFKSYQQEYPRLISPSGVKIVKIDYAEPEFNSTYNRTKIQLKIYATGTNLDNEEQYRLGSRINYYARKSICEVFNTQNLTNSAFNPAFSDNYYFTTAGVEWV